MHLPVATPFADDEGLDRSAFETNLAEWLSHPIAGIVVAGSTGEAPLLRHAELVELVELAGPLTEGRTLTVGTGGEATRDVVAACADVAERGADAVLVRAPYYYRGAMTPAVLREHYLRVADASPVPVLLYHIPKFVSVELVPDLVGRLAEHPNIVGIKDSSGDLRNLGALVEACDGKASVLVGSGALLYAALETGAVGGILGVALIATHSACELHAAWEAGDGVRAGRLQERIGPLHKTIVAGCGVPGVKAALDRLGLVGGPPRRPLPPVDDEVAATVEAALRAAGLGVSSRSG
ncbi:MAG: dihydrodipicolinate synthase family protein [Gemmatimonadota bacterium]|nr:dihydrodipicolinate synthase family protein [Gemmatimonadota bacterium]